MNIDGLLFFLAPSAIAVAILAAIVVRRRIPLERRARLLLAKHPDAERTAVYIAFRSWRPSEKQQEMDAKIAEMAMAGWTFLRGTEASPLRTIRSWGGGVTLQFIRVNESRSSHAA